MFLNYIKELYKYAGKKVVLSIVLFIFMGFTQGVGLIMIIPMLHIIGVLNGANDTSGKIFVTFSKVFEKIGLQPDLISILCIYMLIIAFFSVLRRFQNILNTNIQQGFIVHFRNRLYHALTYADWLFIVKRKVSDLMHSINSDVQAVGVGTNQFLRFTSEIIISLFHIVVAMMISVPLTLFTLIFGGIFGFLMRPLGRRAYQTGVGFREARQGLNLNLMEHLTGMKTAKSYGVEENHIEKVSNYNQNIYIQNLKFTKINANTKLIYEITGALIIAGYLYVTVNILKVPLSSLLLLIYIIIKLLPKFSSLQQTYQYIQKMLPAFEGSVKLYNDAVKAEEHMVDKVSPAEFTSMKDCIEIKNISFSYPETAGKYALNNISLNIQANQITAITGPSGAGKSTLADVLLGLLKPTSGEILIDGKSVNSENVVLWRHHVGYVPQETFLLNDTIKANLLWAKPDASDNELAEALKMAAAESYIQNLPEGMNTVIGDKGIRLSGGERQRLAFARALLRKPSILLLDEATSSLDLKNEEKIHHAIDTLHGKLTIIIIAHDMNTIMRADNIVVLDSGKVIEYGPLGSINYFKK